MFADNRVEMRGLRERGSSCLISSIVRRTCLPLSSVRRDKDLILEIGYDRDQKRAEPFRQGEAATAGTAHEHLRCFCLFERSACSPGVKLERTLFLGCLAFYSHTL